MIMSNPLSQESVAVLEAVQRNLTNPHPELMAGLRKSKYVIGHNATSGYSITIRGLQALEKAQRKSTQSKEI